MLRLAIIGLGNMGFAHAKCVASGEISGAHLSAVCDIDLERLALAKENFPGVALYDDAAALLENALPDAVIIATPHPSHTQLAIAAMEKGIHVLSEKPADIIFSRAASACSIAAKQGLKYAVMFNQRNHPVYRELYCLLQSGVLGGIKRVSWTVTNWYRTQHYYDSGSWRGTWNGEGGGVLINQAPHNLDMICMLFGLPLSVYARCAEGKFHDIAVEDEAILLLRYRDFNLTFEASTGECPGTNRMEIAADYGKVVVENGKIFWTRLPESERVLCQTAKETWFSVDSTTAELPLQGEDTAHKGILQNFVNAIAHGDALTANGEDGVNELMLSNAAYLSSWLGREVALPLQGDAFETALRERAAADKTQKTVTNTAPADGYADRWQARW